MNRNIDKTDLGIRLIVGIGNPGSSYDNTRHNVGFYLLDNLVQHYAASWKLESKWKSQIATIVVAGNKICLLKPQTFVNLSGSAIQAACHFLKIANEQVLVVCDDISIDMGNFKISTIPGTAGHNGIKNIAQNIGEGFIRYRVGIGKKPIADMPLNEYVLSKFTQEEQVQLISASQKFEKNIEVLIDKGVIKGMNFINR